MPSGPGSGEVSADRLIVKGAREHNLRGADLDLRARRPDRVHRPVRLGEVHAGLRHDLRRGPAALRRVAVGVRAPVPRADGQAGRRLHRGPVPGGVDRPEVDQPQPALRPSAPSPRSTTTCVCSTPRAGIPHCPVCGERIARQTPQQIVDQVLAMEEGSQFQVLAPVVRTRKGEFVDLFDKLRLPGLQPGPRRRRGLPAHRPAEAQEAGEARHRGGRRPPHRQGRAAKQRLTDSVETALGLADGILVLEFVDLPRRATRTASGRSRAAGHAPTGTRSAVDDLEPRSFSFNSPYGACPECTWAGHQEGGRSRAGGPGRGADPAPRARSRPGR